MYSMLLGLPEGIKTNALLNQTKNDSEVDVPYVRAEMFLHFIQGLEESYFTPSIAIPMYSWIKFNVR